jgi:putative ABC transport system substrate-binding protein
MNFTRVPLGECVSFLVAFVLVAVQPNSSIAQANAQQTARLKRIGLVTLNEMNPTNVAEFREGLREHDWIDGKNMILEARDSGGNLERFADIAAELVRLPVDVLVSNSVPATLVLKKATQTIPIVAVAATDPAGTGLVTPGGNVAAAGTLLPADAVGRQFDVLRDVVPALRRVGLVWNGSNPAGHLMAQRGRDAAQAAGIAVIPIEVQEPGAALVSLRAKGAQAIFLVSDPRFNRKRVGELLMATGLPHICQELNWAESCVVTYGADVTSLWRRSASYVDRIFKGARPADLPIGAAPPFELVINARLAKGMGLTIPPSVLKRANTIIP